MLKIKPVPEESAIQRRHANFKCGRHGDRRSNSYR
jgi:hypothetical protein